MNKQPNKGLGCCALGDEERALVNEVLDGGFLNRFLQTDSGRNSMASRLEGELADLVGVPHCLAVTSGTAALEVAMMGLGLGPGDEVILPAWSWKSCFISIVRVGARPVLAEIDDSLCLAPGEIRRLATKRTKAVLVVHFQGVAAQMDALLKEADEAGIALIEDCAESPGALFNGKRVASIGRVGIFSFQHNKTVTSGEGGAVFTRDRALFERLIRAHDIGICRPAFAERVDNTGSAFCGGQYRMTELTAAVALGQVRKLDRIRNHCRSLQAIVREREADYTGLTPRLIPDPQGDSGIEMYYFAQSAEAAEAIRAVLLGRNVNTFAMTGTYAQYRQEYCINRASHHPQMNPFVDEPEWPMKGYRVEDFPVTEDLVSRMLAIPFGWLYTEQDARHIADSLAVACASLRRS